MEPVVVLLHPDLGEHLLDEVLVGLDARGKVSSRRNGEIQYSQRSFAFFFSETCKIHGCVIYCEHAHMQ